MRTYPLDFTFFCHGLPMDGDTIPSGKALGGSETGCIQLAETLAGLGHRIVLFCNAEREMQSRGVLYLPIGWVRQGNGNMFPKAFLDYARSIPHDVLVVMRIPGVMAWEFKSKVNFLWQHDLATKTGPSQYNPVSWNIDRVLVISEFMRQQYMEVHGPSPDPGNFFHLTRNGIDIGLVDSVSGQGRDRYKLMFTARPERGLDILLGRVFPRILQREPRATLYLSRYDDVATLPLYEECTRLAASFGPRVVNLGHLGKRDLYEHYKQARLFLYSSVFEEVSGITPVEFGACGGVFLGPWKGALPETLGGTGVLVRDDGSIGRRGDPLDRGLGAVTDRFCERMADEAVELMRDDGRWNALAREAEKRARSLTWDAVAEDWVDLAHRLIEARVSEPRRMVKHFLVNSDVVAARRYADELGDREMREVVGRYIGQFVPFVDIEDADARRQAIADFYEQRSGGDRANWQTAFFADGELRLKVLLDWMRPRVATGEISTVLDFGCAHGGYTRAISNVFPEVKVVGMDISPSLVRCAGELRSAKLPDGSPACLHPENLRFVVGDEHTDLFDTDQGISGYPTHTFTDPMQFDLVIALEVLEHLPDSEEVAKKLERHCRPDGWMCFTTPHGHRERDEWLTKGVPPVHVRAFDRHDLTDLFGHRRQFKVIAFSDLAETDFDRTFSGWFMTLYQNDGGEVGRIDWERKFSLQGPRETLSVCMITHNAEATLHRSLKSVAKIADEIIVVDNGPSADSTVDIARMYGSRVRNGTSPFWCYTHDAIHGQDEIQPGQCDMAGFETPRNESASGAFGDWIWWQDADEAVLNWQEIWRYLRPNRYLGYAVNQHHLSVEPQGELKKDLPVRLFRNRQGLRCVGLVHEHFELGINLGIGPHVVGIPVSIHHDAYLNEPIRRGRFSRNLKLLECDRVKYPDRLLGIYLYDVRDKIHMARYELEQNGGRLTQLAHRLCSEVVETFRKHFLGKDIMLAQDGMNYYTDALQMLGVGLDVVVNIDVRPQGAQLNGGPMRFRVADKEEAKLVMELLLKQRFWPFEGRYVA